MATFLPTHPICHTKPIGFGATSVAYMGLRARKNGPTGRRDSGSALAGRHAP
jgi:hypothetical protein